MTRWLVLRNNFIDNLRAFTHQVASPRLTILTAKTLSERIDNDYKYKQLYQLCCWFCIHNKFITINNKAFVWSIQFAWDSKRPNKLTQCSPASIDRIDFFYVKRLCDVLMSYTCPYQIATLSVQLSGIINYFKRMPNIPKSSRRSLRLGWADHCHKSCMTRTCPDINRHPTTNRTCHLQRRYSSSRCFPWWNTDSHRSSCTLETLGWIWITTILQYRKSDQKLAMRKMLKHQIPATNNI